MTEDVSPIEDAIRARSAAGDYEGAATLVVENYGHEILGFLISRVRDPNMASEIFSQFTEDFWRGFPSFQFRCSARAWAYAVARHAASHHLKGVQRDRRRRVPLSQVSRLSQLAEKVRTETLAAHKTEVKTRIAALRETLPPDDQSLLVLRVNRKLDWREIAQVLLYEGEPLAEEVLKREAARLRKRFQLVKERLRELARAEGLLDNESS